MSRFQIGGVAYDPAKYDRNRPGCMELVDKYFAEWESKQRQQGALETPQIPPSLCLSREIGVGALEIADIIGRAQGWPVVDQSLLEVIQGSAQLTAKTVQLFDERHPGFSMEVSSWLFGEKSFVSGDFSKELLRAIGTIAVLGPNVFVGRGAYLLLPRDRILAVRLIAPKEYRMARMARLLELEIAPERAARELARMDHEQADFYKKILKIKNRPLTGFDLVISRDQFAEAASAAAIIQTAFEEKFSEQI